MELNSYKKWSSDRQHIYLLKGAEIFKMLFPYTKRMYITEIHEDFVGVHYPLLPTPIDHNPENWKGYKGKIILDGFFQVHSDVFINLYPEILPCGHPVWKNAL